MSFKPISVKQQTNNWAVVSLVLGILSWLFLPVFGAIGAIIFGHKAKRDIRNNIEYFSGDGLATAGLALGYIQLVVAALGLIFLFVFWGFGLSRIAAIGNSSKDVKIQNVNIQNVTVKTFDNQTYKLSDYQGKIVVINFWASWSISNREEAADLERVWQEYKDDDVLFFGQNYLDQDHKAKQYLNEFGITYPNGPDEQSKNARIFQVSGLPETYIFNKNGTLAETLKGPTDYETLSAIIRRLLEK